MPLKYLLLWMLEHDMEARPTIDLVKSHLLFMGTPDRVAFATRLYNQLITHDMPVFLQKIDFVGRLSAVWNDMVRYLLFFTLTLNHLTLPMKKAEFSITSKNSATKLLTTASKCTNLSVLLVEASTSCSNSDCSHCTTLWKARATKGGW